jgi:hypothetical protein
MRQTPSDYKSSGAMNIRLQPERRIANQARAEVILLQPLNV